MGFFQESTLISEAEDRATSPRCSQCKLKDLCNSPKLKVIGDGRKSILIVVDHPTSSDDASGRWLKGKSGAWIQSAFVDHGISIMKDCWVTGSFVCHPAKAARGVRPIDASRYCRPLLKQTLEQLDPYHVICIGDTAIQSMMSICYTSEITNASIFYGWTIPAQVGNRWVSCMQHPRGLEDAKRHSTLEFHLLRFIERFTAARNDRPWDTSPDFQQEVEILLRPQDIRRALREMIKSAETCAFDYETNMLKPDGADARVLSASVANLDRCIAFPMLKSVEEVWVEWLKSDCKKTACNIKFEDRWSIAKYRTRPRNWYWCSLQGAHIIQSAPVEFTSLKMQSLLLLGQPRYNKKIEVLLEANGTRVPNRAAEEIALADLLKYNGMDTYLELRVGMKQRELLQYDR